MSTNAYIFLDLWLNTQVKVGYSSAYIEGILIQSHAIWYKIMQSDTESCNLIQNHAIWYRIMLSVKTSQQARCFSNSSKFINSLSQRPQCLCVEWFPPKCTCKVCGSLAKKLHSLHWNFTIWCVCSFFLCCFSFK